MTENDKQWMDGALGAFGRLTNWGGFDDTGGDSIRQLLGRPLKGTAPTAGLSGGTPQMAMPTYQDRLEWHKNKYRNMGSYNFDGSYDPRGVSKAITPAEAAAIQAGTYKPDKYRGWITTPEQHAARIDALAARAAQRDMDRLDAQYMGQYGNFSTFDGAIRYR